MRVTRLEVFGFKSFMERLVLPLEGGITGVVGPNGCGKSNIVDALRWVLGETRASNLRGDTLEDVIFNGTDKLRPLGLAEVSISLRARGDNFFEDLTSATVDTELAALLSGVPELAVESEAAPSEATNANGAQSTTDAPEGESRPRLVVIEGGAGEPQANDGNDRSESDEIAPEDSDGDAERAASEPSTTDSSANDSAGESVGQPASSAPAAALALRFAWLKSANEAQITRRLYRSGESEFFINRVPCRLKDIKDLLRAVGLGPRSYTIVAQGEVGRIISARPEERRMILEEAAGVLGLRDRVTATRRRLEESKTNLSRLNDIIAEVTRQVNSLKRQAARAEARKEIKDRITQLDRLLYRERLIDCAERGAAKEAKLEEIRASESMTARALDTARAEEEAARGSLVNLDVTGDDLRRKIDAIREDLNNRSRQRYEKQSRINELRASANAKGEEIKRIVERQTLLTQRHEESLREVASLKAQYETVSEELRGLERGDEEELRQSAAELARFRDELRTKEGEFRQVRERLIAQKSSLEEIQRQIISLSPLTQLQKTLGQTGSAFLDTVRATTQPFADGLRVPKEYASAVQAILADRAAYLLCEEPHRLARGFVDQVINDPRPRKEVKGLGIGVLQAGDAPASLGAARAEVPFPLLLSLIEIKPGFLRAAAAIFNDIYFVPTLDAAATFFEEQRAAQRSMAGIVLVTAEGEVLTELSFYTLRHEGGIIQLRNRAEEISTNLAGLETQQATLQAAREGLQSSITSAEERHRTALRVSQERQARARALANQQGSLKGRLDAADRLSNQIQHDTRKAGEQIRETEQRIASSQEQQARLEAELAALTSDDEEQLKRDLELFSAEYKKLEPVRNECRSQLSRCSQAVEQARRSLDSLRSQLSAVALERQRVDLERENLQERITAEYGAELFSTLVEELASGRGCTPEERSAATDEVEKLKARVVREGEVDPTSIEQYQIEQTRLEELNGQRGDLEQAIATLNHTVDKLIHTSQVRFIETFNAVAENFSAMIPRLFGGGKGSIELTDPQHPLESGVEILVRPPGKKPKSIELLSGGEKALCATALIFSMFLVRPSPLCVLDEVDAPLDDANLVRLLSMIREMSTRTQFLMITHNKQSMAVSNNLVGVTMQEPGATRIITVSLQDAYKQAS